MASVNANTPNSSVTVAITRGVQLTNTANSRAIASLTAAASVAQFKAKDIFRASGLSLLGVSNWHVEKDRKKIASRKKLSPILLVRGDDRVIIADGYHRLCAVYSIDEDALIPCKIV